MVIACVEVQAYTARAFPIAEQRVYLRAHDPHLYLCPTFAVISVIPVTLGKIGGSAQPQTWCIVPSDKDRLNHENGFQAVVSRRVATQQRGQRQVGTEPFHEFDLVRKPG